MILPRWLAFALSILVLTGCEPAQAPNAPEEGSFASPESAEVNDAAPAIETNSFSPISASDLEKFSSEGNEFISYRGNDYFIFDATQTEISLKNIVNAIDDSMKGVKKDYIFLECIIGADVSIISSLSSVPADYSSFICVNPDDVIGKEVILTLSPAQIETFKEHENVFEAASGESQVSIGVFAKDAEENSLFYVDGWVLLGRSLTPGEAAQRFGEKLTRSASTFSDFVSLIPKRR